MPSPAKSAGPILQAVIPSLEPIFDAHTAAGSATQDHIDAREQQLELCASKFTDPIGENCFVQGDNLRDVGDRILREAGEFAWKMDVPWGICPCKVAGQWYTNDGGYPAAIQRVPLNDHNRAAKARARSGRAGKIRPPDLSLRNHHSKLSKTSRLATAAKGSF